MNIIAELAYDNVIVQYVTYYATRTLCTKSEEIKIYIILKILTQKIIKPLENAYVYECCDYIYYLLKITDI